MALPKIKLGHSPSAKPNDAKSSNSVMPFDSLPALGDKQVIKRAKLLADIEQRLSHAVRIQAVMMRRLQVLVELESLEGKDTTQAALLLTESNPDKIELPNAVTLSHTAPKTLHRFKDFKAAYERQGVMTDDDIKRHVELIDREIQKTLEYFVPRTNQLFLTHLPLLIKHPLSLAQQKKWNESIVHEFEHEIIIFFKELDSRYAKSKNFNPYIICVDFLKRLEALLIFANEFDQVMQPEAKSTLTSPREAVTALLRKILVQKPSAFVDLQTIEAVLKNGIAALVKRIDHLPEFQTIFLSDACLANPLSVQSMLGVSHTFFLENLRKVNLDSLLPNVEKASRDKLSAQIDAQLAKMGVHQATTSTPTHSNLQSQTIFVKPKTLKSVKDAPKPLGQHNKPAA